MAKKIYLELNLDDVAQKLGELSHQVQHLHTAAIQSVNTLATFVNYAYQSRLDDLQDVTQLDRDMLKRWCEELATTTTFTRVEAADYLYRLWQMSDSELFDAMFQWILSSKGI